VAKAVPVAVLGASGRMGHSLIRLMAEYPQLRLHSALAAHGHAALGRDSGEQAGVAVNGVRLGSDLTAALSGAELVIDFSRSEASAAHVEACAEAGVPMLLGTTGLAVSVQAQLAAAARRIPLLVAANTSLAVTVLLELVRQAAERLPANFDVQILETHHRDKRDAPSGTALALGSAVAASARPVGYASLRGGDVVGDHMVHFFGAGERLNLGHSATDRSVFARGALVAGIWLANQAPGRYTMAQALGLGGAGHQK